MMDDLDPFRDGRAAERMGTYLKWMQEGFEAKLSRETVLADAAERYRKFGGRIRFSRLIVIKICH